MPHGDMIVARFMRCFCNMILYFNNYRVGEYKSQELQFHMIRGSILPKQRREIILEALKEDADYLLWLDTDHMFPRNMLHRMISHGKEVLAVNCATKTLPAQPTARYAPRPGTDDPIHGTPCYTDADSPELEKVWRVGTGIMLVNMKVYKRMKEHDRNHLFDMFFRDDVMNYQGEDWTMVEMFEKMGVDVWIDHPLSDQTAHVGLFEFTHEHVGSLEKIEHIQENPKILEALTDAVMPKRQLKRIGEA